MRTMLIGPIMLLAASIPAQGRQRFETVESVPFVGCPSGGQLGFQHPPQLGLTPSLPSNIARSLAYYAAAYGPGVLAPRGWHCGGIFGSAGSGLTVYPGNRYSVTGPAVELSYNYGGTSGRWSVAEAIARYFPSHRSFIKKEFQGLEVGPLPSSPYPHDTISVRTDRLVRYVTPPLTKGQGTSWQLSPGSLPVEGLVMLMDDAGRPDVLRLSVRLADRHLARAILDNSERKTWPQISKELMTAATHK